MSVNLLWTTMPDDACHYEGRIAACNDHTHTYQRMFKD